MILKPKQAVVVTNFRNGEVTVTMMVTMIADAKGYPAGVEATGKIADVLRDVLTTAGFSVVVEHLT